MLEITCADDPADNVGPVAAMLYVVSPMCCMTTSLPHGGAALGTGGSPETRARELCPKAGFSAPRRPPVDDPLNAPQEVRP